MQDFHIISPNRSRIPPVLLLGLIFCGLSTYALIKMIRSADFSVDYLFVYLLFFWGVMLYYSVLAAADYFRTLFDREVSLTISQDGLDERLSLFSCGKLGWSELEEGHCVILFRALRTKFLLIKVASPDIIIGRQKKWKHRLLRAYTRKFGTPIIISSRRVNCSLEELRELISAGGPRENVLTMPVLQ